MTYSAKISHPDLVTINVELSLECPNCGHDKCKVDASQDPFNPVVNGDFVVIPCLCKECTWGFSVTLGFQK